jgi:hypothetical protein
MRSLGVLLGVLAVLVRRGRMLFPFLVVSMVVMMGRLQVVVRRRLMVRGRILVMLRRSVFFLFSHFRASVFMIEKE